MTAAQVRAVDGWAISSMSIAGVVLMENAGSRTAEIIIQRLGDADGKRVSIFCGAGNNGGDGYVIARHLHNAGSSVKVLICADRAKITGDALINLQIIEKMELDIESIDPAVENAVQSASDSDIIVDAIFGTGLTGQLRGNYIKLIENINGLDVDVVAVDIPSGLDCDEGVPLGAAINAVATVTFVAVKKGFKNITAKKYTGDIYIASIGIQKPEAQAQG
jgi:hydroxyethylthiazole kinase-like uncharacterized protein yjeF